MMILKTTMLLASVAGTVAFAPAPRTGRVAARTGLSMSTKDMAGIAAFPGFFDPLGLSQDKSDDRIRYFREAELKHGRVAMLAALGFLVGEITNGPFFNVREPSVIAFQATPLQNVFPFVVLFVGGIEFATSVPNFRNPSQGLWQLESNYELGDLGFDPLGLKPAGDDLKNMKTKELNNGRLAMIGIAGMIAQELVTGQKLFDIFQVYPTGAV